MTILTSLMKPSPSGFSAAPVAGARTADQHAGDDRREDEEVKAAEKAGGEAIGIHQGVR